MIIQTGMRTDIPAFYSEWFINRLRDGFVMVRNPYNPQSVTRYDLSPEVVDLIGFCTKNPKPMLPHLELLDPYAQYWFITITPYGADIEKNVPPKEEVIESFIELSERLGADIVSWRYDPIIIDDTYTISKHIEEFEKMVSALDGYTKVCVISFLQKYEKLKFNYPEAKEPSIEDRKTLGKELLGITSSHGMILRPCSDNSLAEFGADCKGCMTLNIYEDALRARFGGGTLHAPSKKPARSTCACYLAGDIGEYNTCLHGCRYCYANYSEAAVKANYQKHDPTSPLLIGELSSEDAVHNVEQKSWYDRQLRFEW